MAFTPQSIADDTLFILLADRIETKKFGCGKFGKDPTVETSFLPDRCDFSLAMCSCV